MHRHTVITHRDIRHNAPIESLEAHRSIRHLHKKDIQKENYRKFYKTNIKENHYLVYDVDKIYSQIKHYIELRK